MRELSAFTTMRYLLQRLLLLLVVLCNLLAFYFVVTALHRLVAKGATDLVASISLVVSLLSSLAVWKMAQSLVIGDSSTWVLSSGMHRRLHFAGHIVFWGMVPILWWIVLPLASDYFYGLGVEAKKKQHYANAIDLMQRSLYQQNHNAKAHYALAAIYEDLADVDSAMRHYRLGIHIDQDYPVEAFNNLSRLLLIRGNESGAMDLLDLAEQRIDHSRPDAEWLQTGVIHKNRAWVYWQLGLYADAEKHIVLAKQHLQATRFKHNYPEIECLHALVAQQNNQKRIAKKSAELCLETYKNYRNNLDVAMEPTKLNSPYQGASRELYLQILIEAAEQ